MKALALLSLLFLKLWGVSESNPFRCLLFRGKCVVSCPPDMHSYHTRCDEDAMSQRTCAFPYTYTLGFTCGWSRCDCNNGLILDEDVGLCVQQDKCGVAKAYRRRSRKKFRPKKLKLTEDEDIVRGVAKCPEHMHELHSECRSTPSQRTCDEPVAKAMGVICDWTRCDCDFPFVLHLASGYCFLYTGHCPMLKFRYGKCYGDNTRQILREIKSNGLFNKPLEYRRGDNYELDRMPRRDAPRRDVYDGLNHQPTHMTGYTGYVPGMNFRYGKSYGRAADDCLADFAESQRTLRRKADFNKNYIRSRSAPKMETIHTRDEIRRDLNRFREINKYKENTISPEFPPIAGYTGHIPRIKGSEASLSQRYHCAAKRGLELIRMERDQREELHRADAKIKSILKDHDKFSYWNWG